MSAGDPVVLAATQAVGDGQGGQGARGEEAEVDKSQAHHLGVVIETLEVGGVSVAYTCSALCIHLDWQAPALRHGWAMKRCASSSW